MSALGTPVLINKDRAYWLSSIANDVVHSTIVAQELDSAIARFSTVYVSDFLTTSTLNASSFTLTNLDLSEANISTLKTNQAFTSSLTWASDLSGGVGTVNITTDPSGVRVFGDPIRFDNLVYLTSTINIIQVSTLVDTDIFASNGFFSSLSSGSISAGALQASTLFVPRAGMSTLFVSSITTTDISGFSPSNWSLYPTLNSSITFNGTNVLSNVGNKLFFSGFELTDSSGGGADWSAFPAYQDVSMNNFSLRGLSTLQYNDGARLYSQTGNNLFYNGQQISYGTLGAASNWAKYPANSNIVTTGYGVVSGSSLPVAVTSNIQVFAQGVSTVVDQGLNLASVANFDVTVQNGNRGSINLTANGGNNNGIFGSINLTANGATLAGVGATGGLISLTANTPLGTPCNATSAIKFSAAGINSYAGAIPSVGSLAGYNFIYGTGGVNICAGIPSIFPNVPTTTFLYGLGGVVTSSDFYVPNIYPYWNGLTTPPDLMITGRYIVPNLAQVYVQLSNVKYLYMDGAAQIQNAALVSTVSTIGQVANFGTGQFGSLSASAAGIAAANITTVNSQNIYNAASTVTSTIYCSGQAQVSTLLWNLGVGISTIFNNLRVNNIKIADDITGVTNAPMPLESRIVNFSSINSFNMSTTDLWVSSINGQPIDISGQPFVNTNRFSTLFTSSFKVSTLSGFQSGNISCITVDGGFQFVGNAPGTPTLGGRFISSLRSIDSRGQDLTITGGGPGAAMGGSFDILYQPGGTNNIRIGGGGFYDTRIRELNGGGCVSTVTVMASSIIGHPTGGIDISGGVYMNNTTYVPDGQAVQFDDFSFTTYSRLERRDIANNNMLAVTNTPGLASNNMNPLAVGELWLTGGADQYAACRLYSEFPYGNYELDAIDADGVTLFAYMQGYQNPFGINPGYVQAYSNVSSISGYNENSATNPYLNVIGSISTGNLNISSINGLPYGGGTVVSTFQNLYADYIKVSTLESVGSNTNFNYPIFVDWDQGGDANAGVAIAVQGHSYGSGSVQNRIEMGARGNGENYIMSVWPGQNLEDLVIDATELKVRDSDGFSTIVNLNPYGLVTNGGISAPLVLVSSINGTNALPAYGSFLTLSSMNLVQSNTTLLHFSTAAISSNIQFTDYDIRFQQNGVYKCGVSFQFDNTSGNDVVEYFFQKNSNTINYSGTITTVPNNTEHTAYTEIMEYFSTGETLQVGMYTDEGDVFISTIQGAVAISPAAITTVYRVDTV